MNRNAEYDAVRDLIAAHQTSEVEQGSGIPAPSDAGREEVPLPASRPATFQHPFMQMERVRECVRCGKSFMHVASFDQCCSLGCAREYKRAKEARRVAKSPLPYPCDHCDEGFRSRKSRGAHVASVHPYTRIKPSYIPPPDDWVELPGDRWSA